MQRVAVAAESGELEAGALEVAAQLGDPVVVAQALEPRVDVRGELARAELDGVEAELLDVRERGLPVPIAENACQQAQFHEVAPLVARWLRDPTFKGC